MKHSSETSHSSMAGWQAWLRSLLMLYVCLFNMAIPFWHELDVEEHDVSHLDCHVKDATHLHEQPEAVGSHDHEHCAICQNAFNHVFAACQQNFRATAEKITLPHLWEPVCEFVARVALPIHPQAP